MIPLVDDDGLQSLQFIGPDGAVNAGVKMHRLAGVKMHHG
jgi:hypothetical protein